MVNRKVKMNAGFSDKKSAFAKGFGNGIMKSDGKMILMLFIGLIIGIALYTVIVDSVTAGTVTSNTFTNQTVTAPAVNNSLELTGRDLVGTGTVRNVTSPTIPGTSIREEVGTNGQKSVVLHLFQNGSAFAGDTLNLTYTSVPDGAVTGGARGIFLLVVIFGAIAILVFGVVMLFSGSFRKLIGK